MNWLSKCFTERKVELDGWLKEYALRRYGSKWENTHKALLLCWKVLNRPGTNGTELSSIMLPARPCMSRSPVLMPDLGIPYSPWLLIEAQAFMLKDAGILRLQRLIGLISWISSVRL